MFHDFLALLSSSLTSQWLPWSIIGAGIVLRAAQYFANRSLWLDESMLALNILQRSPSQLLQPLDYEQVAPVGFLMAEKLALAYLGDSEYALRLFPLLAGMASLPLFYAVARLCLPQQAALLGLLLFAFSGPLIYYSSELKQYSSDVAIALWLSLLALRIIRQPTCSWCSAALLGGSGAVALWCSHPAIFILAGIGVGLFISQLARVKRRAWRELGPVLSVGLLWIVTFAILYSVSYQAVDGQQLTEYWRESFMPLPPSTVADIRWFGVALTGLLRDPVGLGSATIAAMVFGIGCASMLAANKAKCALLLSPLGFALIASGLHFYPFNGRLLLFIVPAILLCIAAGLFQILQYSGRFAWMMKCALLIVLIAPPLQTSAHHLFAQPRLREEIAPVLRYIQHHWQEADTLYVYYGAIPAFRYYQTRLDFAHAAWIEGIASREDWQYYLDDVEKLRGRQRVWVLLSHIHRRRDIDERVLIVNHLDRIGKRLNSVQAHGAVAYLYDMGTMSQVPAPMQAPATP